MTTGYNKKKGKKGQPGDFDVNICLTTGITGSTSDLLDRPCESQQDSCCSWKVTFQ